MKNEKIVLFSNDQEIARITNDATMRASMLNSILDAGVPNDDVNAITADADAIEKYIHKRHLTVNKKLRELEESGIQVSATLPEDLQAIKYKLEAWRQHVYRGTRYASKTEFLAFDNGRWHVDHDALERYFVRSIIKYYLPETMREEYENLLKFCSYFQSAGVSCSEAAVGSFLWRRLEPVAAGILKPRWTYFRNQEEQLRNRAAAMAV